MPDIEQMIGPGASPNTGNYLVGRGIGYVKLIPPTLNPDPAYVDCGNITEFTFQVKPTRLDHYSSRVGVRRKDLTVVTELAATLTIIMEEFTARNLSMALLGIEELSGTATVAILQQPLIYAAFKFVGTNTVGPQWTYEFPVCLLTPSKAINLLPAGSGTWGAMDFEADVLYDSVSQGFGTAHAAVPA
jgi:hypothetical protein